MCVEGFRGRREIFEMRFHEESTRTRSLTLTHSFFHCGLVVGFGSVFSSGPGHGFNEKRFY